MRNVKLHPESHSQGSHPCLLPLLHFNDLRSLRSGTKREGIVVVVHLWYKQTSVEEAKNKRIWDSLGVSGPSSNLVMYFT